MGKGRSTQPQVSAPPASRKYEEAIRMYATTEMTGKQIAEACRISVSGFRVFLRRYHRDLVLRRHGVEAGQTPPESIKLRGKRGQTPAAHAKYKRAIEACDDPAYIEYNVSQIARMFDLDGTSLGNQLKLHYPGIVERREAVRARLGLADNTLRGPHPDSVKAYARAVELLRATDKNLPRIAEECGVSLGGLSQYLRFYHKELLGEKTVCRDRAVNNRRLGKMCGNNRTCEPTDRTREKYAEALRLYRETGLTVGEIAARAGVPVGGFRNHLRRWHRDLMLERRGITDTDGADACNLDLGTTKRYLKSAATKYAPAIASLRARIRPVAQVAAEFGLPTETFRWYLRKHEPELIAAIGRERQAAKGDTETTNTNNFK